MTLAVINTKDAGQDNATHVFIKHCLQLLGPPAVYLNPIIKLGSSKPVHSVILPGIHRM